MTAESETNGTKRRLEPGTWVYDKDLGCMVPKYGRNYFDYSELRADLPSPAIRPDGMRAIKSMADGRTYESKSAYYKSVSRSGCEVVGFDKDWEGHIKAPQPFGSPKAHEADLVADVKKSFEIERSKLPPSGGLEDRRRARKQKKLAKGAA